MTHEMLPGGGSWQPPEPPTLMTRGFGRAHWTSLIADGNPDAVAVCVLDRLQEDGFDALLAIDSSNLNMVERYLRRLALERLGREPIRQRQVDEVRGHPRLLAELAFEGQGYPLLAAALYALNHDALLPWRNDGLEDELLDLRLAFATCLSEAEPTRRPWALELVGRTGDRLEKMTSVNGKGALMRQKVDTWLAAQRTRLAIDLANPKADEET